MENRGLSIQEVYFKNALSLFSDYEYADKFNNYQFRLKNRKPVYYNPYFQPTTPPLRFINTRHPLARLHSCWRDKFVDWYLDNLEYDHEHNDNVHHVFGRYYKKVQLHETEESLKILKEYNEPGDDKLKQKHGKAQVSFFAFLDFILNGKGYTSYYRLVLNFGSENLVPIFEQEGLVTLNFKMDIIT